MPHESPSSSRGPPTSSPRHSTRFRASRKTSLPPTRVPVTMVEGSSGTWAVSGRTTPNRVAPLPARRARQMFFVADYDAVCAIMTTSLFLSPAPPLSLHLTSLPLTPRITALGGWIFFYFPFFPSFSVPYLLSSPRRRGQTLLLPQPLATTSSRTREEASELLLFLTAGFRAIYVYP